MDELAYTWARDFNHHLVGNYREGFRAILGHDNATTLKGSTSVEKVKDVVFCLKT